MKVYSISKRAFFGICVLILILPLSRHWKLFFLGESVLGTVKEFKMIVRKNLAGEKEILYVSEIHFQVQDSVYLAHGPADIEFDTGREIRLKYMADDPSDHRTRACADGSSLPPSAHTSTAYGSQQ